MNASSLHVSFSGKDSKRQLRVGDGKKRLGAELSEQINFKIVTMFQGRYLLIHWAHRHDLNLSISSPMTSGRLSTIVP
jgi:hypothetical protein